MQPPAGSSDDKIEMDQIRLEAFVKVDGKWLGEEKVDAIPVMVSITASPRMVGQREDVDLVLCIHHHGSEVTKKHKKLLTEAVKVITDTLGDRDRLAIFPVDMDLCPISHKKNWEADLDMGIRTDLPLVTALETAESILYQRGHHGKERCGHIIIISNSRGDIASLESLLPWRFRSVHALGFRNAKNAKTLYSISANNRDCTYGVLDDEYGEITKALDATMKRITSKAGGTMPIEVKLRCEQNAILSSIDSPLVNYFISSDKKAGIIWASAQLGCSRTNFVVRLSSTGDGKFPHDEHYEWSNLLKVEVKNDQVSGKANAKGDQVSDKIQLQGEVVAVKKGMDGYCGSNKPKKVASEEVAAEIMRYKAVQIVTSIVESNRKDWERLHADANELHTQWSTYKNSPCGVEATEGGLTADLDENIKEMEIRMYNNYLWEEYMRSWLSHQWWKLPLPPLFMDKQAVAELPVQLEIFAKTATPDHQSGLPVLLRVKVPETGLAKLKTPSVDVIMVVDINRLRPRLLDKLNLLANAVNVVMDKLTHKDRLAILPVESSTTITQPPESCSFLEMSQQGQRETLDNIKALIGGMKKKATMDSARRKPTQTSTWRKQVNKTIKTIGNCLHISHTNTSTATRTSPERQGTAPPTHSAAADGSIKQLPEAIMDASKMLDDRPQHMKDHMGFIIVISDSDDDSICQQELSPNYTIHAFGFNGMHNARAMYYIVSRTNGIYGILDDGNNRITEAFMSCINKIATILVVDTEVEFTCSDSSSSTAALSTIESGQFKSSVVGKSCSILLGAIHATSVKNLIVYMDNVCEGGHDNLSKLFTVQVSCYPARRTMEEKQPKGGRISSSSSRINRYDDEVVVAGIARVAAVKMVTKIIDPNLDKHLVTCLPGEIETMQEIFASVTEKLDANLLKKKADPNYNTKLVQRLAWEMCLIIHQYTRDAGKARRARDREMMRPTGVNYQHSKFYENHVYTSIMKGILMEKLETMEANLYKQINAPNYYVLLVGRLLEELPPKGSEYSAQKGPKTGLMEEKMALEMENMEAYFSRQITDPTNNKELVKNLVKRMCESCARHAQVHGEVQLATEFENMHHRVGTEMVAVICMNVSLPMYYKRLMACLARLTCLNASERERALGNARYALLLEKMEATLAWEMRKVEANEEDHVEIINPMGYHQKMVLFLVREMCLKVCVHAEVAGRETRLIEEMQYIDVSLHTEMPDSNYYKTLVANKLPYLLSWLSFQGSCELDIESAGNLA